jgi:hypothetical protein
MRASPLEGHRSGWGSLICARSRDDSPPLDWLALIVARSFLVHPKEPKLCLNPAIAGSVKANTEKLTHFLNVDLDIYSKYDLQPLVTAMSDKVFVLHVGRYKRTYRAHLELAASGLAKSPDSTLRKFCALIGTLPRTAVEVWNAAKVRDFNIGVQAGTQPNSFEFALAPETVRAVSEVNARIAFTVYAAGLGKNLPAV